MDSSISYSTLIGWDDLPLACRLIPHQLTQLGRARFSAIRLVVDDFRHDLKAYEDALSQVLEEFPVARVVSLADFYRQRRDMLKKHVQGPFIPVRDFRGVPFGGWIAGIEPFDSAYHFHSDCDILYGGREIQGWLDHALHKLNGNASLYCVSPHPGPCGPLKGQAKEPFSEDGVYHFAQFSSRRFLISRSSESILPHAAKPVRSRKTVLKNALRCRSVFKTWEMTVSDAMKAHGLFRGHTRDLDAWSIHIDQGKAQVLSEVEHVLRRILDRQVPQAQQGQYDFQLDAWF